MNIIGWILLGAFSGWLATYLSDTSKGKGCFFNMILGIVGAFLGGFIFEFLGGHGITGFNIWSVVVATIGAMLILLISKNIRNRK